MEPIDFTQAVLAQVELLVVDLPVEVTPGTLFITRKHDPPLAVFALTCPEVKALVAVSFGLNSDIKTTAQQVADLINRRRPWEPSNDHDPQDLNQTEEGLA